MIFTTHEVNIQTDRHVLQLAHGMSSTDTREP